MQGIVQGRRTLDPEDLSIEQETYNGLGYRMHLGQIRPSGRVVSVKVYSGSHAKKRCADTAKFLIERGVMHPNIPHLIAVSGLKSEAPFLVFDGEYEDTTDRLLSWVLKKETKEILTFGLQTVIGLSSGLDYLQELNYPFASVGLDHFVVLSSKGKIVISFDPEELEPTGEPDRDLGLPNHSLTDTAHDFFHKLCQRTFNDACKAHYKSRHSQRTYHDEFDDNFDENRFEEFDDNSSPSPAPASSSATTKKPSPRSPSGRRQELVWRSPAADAVTLKDISRQFQSFLNFQYSSSEPVLSRRRGRYTARTSHRCPGYSRIEVTLTTNILRSSIVSHSSPTPGEICPVCKEVVEEEILNCLCGNFDDETMPTVRCSTCFEWHHRPCVGGFGTDKFVCRRCNIPRFRIQSPTAQLHARPAPRMQDPQQSFHFSASPHLPAHPHSSPHKLVYQIDVPGSSNGTVSLYSTSDYAPGVPQHASEIDPRYWKSMFIECSETNGLTVGQSANNGTVYSAGGTFQTSGASPQFPTGFPNYEMQHERYSPQASFPAYVSRSSTPNMINPTDSRRLPPLTTLSTPPIGRWQQPSFIPRPTGFPGNPIRSPAASYPPAYVAYSSANQANAYSYHMQPHDKITSMNPQGHGGMFEDVPRLDPGSSSGYALGVPQHASELDAHYWKNMFIELGFGETVDPIGLPGTIPSVRPMPR